MANFLKGLVFFAFLFTVSCAQCASPDDYEYPEGHAPYVYEPEAAEVEVEVAIPDTVDVEKERGNPVLQRRALDLRMRKIYFTFGTIIFAALCFYEPLYRWLLLKKKKSVDGGESDEADKGDDDYVDVKKPKVVAKSKKS